MYCLKPQYCGNAACLHTYLPIYKILYIKCQNLLKETEPSKLPDISELKF